MGDINLVHWLAVTQSLEHAINIIKLCNNLHVWNGGHVVQSYKCLSSHFELYKL